MIGYNDNGVIRPLYLLLSQTTGYINIFDKDKITMSFMIKDVIRPLYLLVSQMTGYMNKFDKNKITMSLMIKDIQLLKNYNKILKKN